MTWLAGVRPPGGGGSECILRIGPGAWDLGGTPLIMVEGVDIQGSGIDATVLRGNYSSGSGRGIVQGASRSSLRDIFIQNQGSDTFLSGISANNTNYFYLDHVRATTTGSPTFSFGLHIANELNSSGATRVFIRDSRLGGSSSGTNTGLRILSETTERLEVDITHSELIPNGSNATAISVHTTFATSTARAEVTYSKMIGLVKASGNGSSRLLLHWSNILGSISATGSGDITCRFVTASAGSSTDTCP